MGKRETYQPAIFSVFDIQPSLSPNPHPPTPKNRTGKVLGPQHRVPVSTALKALTIWPAWQHFEEENKGSIEVGKVADFVVLSENPLEIDADMLADIKILRTIKGGETIYERPDKEASIPKPASFGTTLVDQ